MHFPHPHNSPGDHKILIGIGARSSPCSPLGMRTIAAAKAQYDLATTLSLDFFFVISPFALTHLKMIVLYSLISWVSLPLAMHRREVDRALIGNVTGDWGRRKERYYPVQASMYLAMCSAELPQGAKCTRSCRSTRPGACLNSS